MSRIDEAIVVLDDFLYEDIFNRQEIHAGEWDLTYQTPEFVLRHRESGDIINLRVEIVPGDLTETKIRELAEEQEWFDE